jgi:hypothetical protein
MNHRLPVRLLAAILVAFATVGAERLGAQTYSASVAQLKTNFRNTLVYMSAAQLRTFAAQIAAQWKQLDDLEAAATALDALPATIEPARSRAALATNEWRIAQARSAAARTTFDTNLRAFTQSYAKAFGDQMERFGLPRTGGEFQTTSRSRMAQFEAAIASLEAMKVAPERALYAEKAHVEALEAITRAKQTTAQHAGQEVAALEATLSTRAAAFGAVRVNAEAAMSGRATPGGLTPFPNSRSNPTLEPSFVRPNPGVNTNALDQARANLQAKPNFHRDCFDDPGCPVGSRTDGFPQIAIPPAIAASLDANPAYRAAQAAVALAEQRLQEAHTEFRKIWADPQATQDQRNTATMNQFRAKEEMLRRTHTFKSFRVPATP